MVSSKKIILFILINWVISFKRVYKVHSPTCRKKNKNEKLNVIFFSLIWNMWQWLNVRILHIGILVIYKWYFNK